MPPQLLPLTDEDTPAQRTCGHVPVPLGPLVSVIIPSKNRAALLEKALQNCLSQTYTNLEVVVVNDGSTDGTDALVRRLMQQDSRLHLISNTRSVGLPVALNMGFASCRGQLLTWTSDDNRYAPNAIARMQAILAADSRLDFVYCDYRVVYETGETEIRHLAAPAYLSERNCVGACFLYRRKVRDRVGDYCPELVLAEDYDYWLRVYLSGAKMFHLSEGIYDYSVHRGSLGSQAGQLKVNQQACASRARRLSPLRREWIRLRRRSLLVWSRYLRRRLGQFLPR